MSPLTILEHAPGVVEHEIDGTAHVDLQLAEPELLVQLSAALHREGLTAVRGVAFRALAFLAAEDRQVRAAALLGLPDVRAALTLTLTPAAAKDLEDALHDARVTVYGDGSDS